VLHVVVVQFDHALGNQAPKHGYGTASCLVDYCQHRIEIPVTSLRRRWSMFTPPSLATNPTISQRNGCRFNSLPCPKEATTLAKVQHHHAYCQHCDIVVPALQTLSTSTSPVSPTELPTSSESHAISRLCPYPSEPITTLPSPVRQ
jgi:hypothetical protein